MCEYVSWYPEMFINPKVWWNEEAADRQVGPEAVYFQTGRVTETKQEQQEVAKEPRWGDNDWCDAGGMIRNQEQVRQGRRTN